MRREPERSSPPGTYGMVSATGRPGGTFQACRMAEVPQRQRRERDSQRATAEKAEHRVREHPHSIGLRDARNGAVSVREHVTEAEGGGLNMAKRVAPVLSGERHGDRIPTECRECGGMGMAVRRALYTDVTYVGSHCSDIGQPRKGWARVSSWRRRQHKRCTSYGSAVEYAGREDGQNAAQTRRQPTEAPEGQHGAAHAQADTLNQLPALQAERYLLREVLALRKAVSV
jgi:hypothetical protein